MVRPRILGTIAPIVVAAGWAFDAGSVARAAAEPPPDAGVLLSLSAALDRAVVTVPQLALAERRVAEASATRVGAGIRVPSNPRVQFDVRPTLQSGGGGPGFLGQFDVPFEVANAAGARLAEADRRVDLARTEQQVSRLEARLLVFHAYVAMATADLRLEQTHQAVAIAERMKRVATERLAAGAGNDIEVTSADVELAQSRAMLAYADGYRSAAEVELRFLLAIDERQPLRLTTQIETPPAVPAPAELMAFAYRRRPDLLVIARRLDLLAAADTRLRREALPKLGVFAGLDASPDSPRFGFAGLSVDLPLAQRNQGPRAQVAAARESNLTLLDVERRALRSDILAVHNRHEAGRRALEVLTEDGIPAAQRRFSLVETGWHGGRFDVFRLTSAAGDLVRLRERRLQALTEVWQDRIALERLTGGWSEETSSGN